jgi:hypothetical protein
LLQKGFPSPCPSAEDDGEPADETVDNEGLCF